LVPTNLLKKLSFRITAYCLGLTFEIEFFVFYPLPLLLIQLNPLRGFWPTMGLRDRGPPLAVYFSPPLSDLFEPILILSVNKRLADDSYS
jgi:hypothetical protein